MAKKLQRQAQSNEGTEAPRHEPAIETAAEVATAVAEHEGAATAPIARIGPDVSGVEAATAAIREAREDAAHALAKICRRVAEGETLSRDEERRAAELIETARWTIGQYEAEIITQKRRAQMRAAAATVATAEQAIASARAGLDSATEARAKALAELDAAVAAARNALAQAESDLRVGEQARKLLVQTAPEVLRQKHTAARNAANELANTVRSLERRAGNDLTALNTAKAQRDNTVEQSPDRAAAEKRVTAAQATFDATSAELASARQRLAEVEEDARELLRLCEVA